MFHQEFLHWFCETLFQVLHPGASFSRCLMALHLLGIIAEHFTFNTGINQTFLRTFKQKPDKYFSYNVFSAQFKSMLSFGVYK